MKSTSLHNLSGRAIPDNAEILISGAPRTDDVLVIGAFDGLNGTASWLSRGEMDRRRVEITAQAEATPARPSWAEPLKPKAPYT